MRYIWPLLLLFSALSCAPDDEVITTDRKAVLSFSADTVLFDTVFVSQGSITKRLKVYNSNKRAVRIGNINLAGAVASPYTITINGMQTPAVNNFELRGGDSLSILVKVTINPSDASLPFLVADSILFDTNGKRQSVKLVAYGQNAHFIRKGAIGTTTWTSGLPYVLLDTLLVTENSTLTIEKGTRIYAANKAVLLVNGRLLVAGTPTERVVFSGYRREPSYATAPGQWEGIRILTRSQNNVISYADIRNTLYGLRVGNPGRGGTLVESCIIQYALRDGIIGFTSDIKVVNTLIHNCGQYSFAGLGGGNYEILYSTIVNYSNPVPREVPAFAIADYIPGTDIKDQATNLRLINSIVYSEGSNYTDEVLLALRGDNATIEVANNILRTEEYKTLLQGNDNKLNVDPMFKEPSKLDFSLKASSPAEAAAQPLAEVNVDIKGTSRHAVMPTIGAYEVVE